MCVPCWNNHDDDDDEDDGDGWRCWLVFVDCGGDGERSQLK